jgi:hypothetical protein
LQWWYESRPVDCAIDRSLVRQLTVCSRAAQKKPQQRKRSSAVDGEDAHPNAVGRNSNSGSSKPQTGVTKSKSLVSGLGTLSDADKLRELRSKYDELNHICEDGVALQTQLQAALESCQQASNERIAQLTAENARLKKQLDSSKSSAAGVSSEHVLRLSDENASLSARCEDMMRTLALYGAMTSIDVEAHAPNVFRCTCTNARVDGRVAVFDLTMNANDEIEFAPIDIPLALQAPSYMRESIVFDSHDLPQLLSNLLAVVFKRDGAKK